MIDALSLLPEHHQTQFDSRFRIVLIAAQRAKHIMRGAPTPGSNKFIKETSSALEEVLNGDVKYFMGEDARQAIKQAKGSAEREFDPALLAQTDENAKEIQKELSVYIDDSPKTEEAVADDAVVEEGS
ncbi:MAG: DNA-directed RNA polymerase subunit omega [Nitrospirales bacterium]